ncbi:MAG: hypothetical protein ACRENI_08655 [Gemmatimonadaceae bacterium]
MARHITLLGVLYIALGALGLFAAVIVFVAIAGGGLLSADVVAITITSTVSTIIALFLVIISAPGVIAGVGLLGRKRWARPLALVLGALNLFNFPFGTALGVYTFWVLLNREAEREFLAAAG